MIHHIAHSRHFQLFWAAFGGVSIRVKVLGIILAMIALLGLFVTQQIREVLTVTLGEELEAQGTALSLQIGDQVKDIVTSGNQSQINSRLLERQAHYSNSSHNTLIAFLLVMDRDGALAGDTFGGDVPTDILALTTLQDHPTVHNTSLGTLMTFDYLLSQSGATLWLGLAQDKLVRTVDTVTWQIIIATLITVAFGFGAAFFLTYLVTRPIIKLVDATQAVAQGDFSVRVDRWANDEIGDLTDAFNKMAEALEAADRARAQYIKGVIHAQEEERKRIARELHDSTSQSLTSLLVGLRNLETTTEPAIVTHHLKDLRDIVDTTLQEVHNMARQLRPTVLDDMGLPVALQRYVTEFQQRHAIHVDFIAHGISQRFSVETETAIYRIIQEGLTNIARHAQAENASVMLECRPGDLRIIIEDDGVGFDTAAAAGTENHLGLQGIRERARLLGGDLIIESSPGQGTSLFIRLPVQHPAPASSAIHTGKDLT